MIYQNVFVESVNYKFPKKNKRLFRHADRSPVLSTRKSSLRPSPIYIISIHK
jgi:hypothetical protein